MTLIEITSLVTNLIVVAFLVWSYVRRKNVDDRIDRLATILATVTDLLDKNRSWEKSAKEIRALEEIYERKVKAEIDAHSKESLESLKNIKRAEIDARCDLELIETAIKLFVPKDLKSLIHAQMLRQGYSSTDRHVKVFFTSAQDVSEALLILAQAEQRSTNSIPSKQES